MLAEAQIFADSFWDGMTPDPIYTVSQWADEHRVLSSKASAEPGRYRTSRTPYLKEIMDCLSSDSPIEEIVVIKGAQLGATEAGNNWIGYIIDCVPGRAMALQPPVDRAKSNSKQRLAPLIEECPRLSSKVKTARARDSGNTILEKDFPGGRLVLTGANSAVGLRSMPARYLFLDEVDGYPGDVDGEGDPVALAKARTRTFKRKKIFIVSTPTFSGRSRIEAAFDATDRRRFYLPCPHCGQFQHLKFAQLKWPHGKPEQALYICEHCQTGIQEFHKTRMLAAGKWIAENPGARGGRVAGFHINSLNSPLGWFSWGEAAEQWMEAQGKPELLRGFINTVLGETWKDKGDAPEWRRIYDKRETHDINTIPSGVVFLTAGCDVQKDRIEVEICGWGRDKQSWSIDYRILYGDTASDEPWDKLDAILAERWTHKSGCELSIRALAVDTGYNTQHVYNWARRYPMDRVYAVKGIEHASLPIGSPTIVDVTRSGKKVRRGCRLWPVGVNVLKSELYSWLRLDGPTDPAQPYPRGYCHFPQYGEEYFKQLTAEEMVATVIRGHRKYEWVKTRDRNEALDCRVYNRAAAAAVGIDRIRPDQWDALEAEFLGTPPAETVGSAAPTETPPAPRRRSSYWERR